MSAQEEMILDRIYELKDANCILENVKTQLRKINEFLNFGNSYFPSLDEYEKDINKRLRENRIKLLELRGE